MRRSTLLLALLALCLGCGYTWYLPAGLTINLPGRSGDPLAEADLRRTVVVPQGFSISTWASGVPSARMMRFTSTGDLLVTVPREGKVVLLEADADGDGASDGTRVLVAGLDRPHGLDIHDGWLYVAEGDAVVRMRFDAAARTVGPGERIVRGLPSGGNHWTRTVGVGPDGNLYVSIGSSCNVCDEDDPRRAAIVRYRLDGTGETVHATGLRNAVGFDWRPGTGELYATDNGRDLLGDDFPPCELNRVVEGAFYGWPVANGNRVPDPDLGEGQEARIAASVPPVHGFGAHTAPLGIAFYDGTSFPARYRGAAFVAQHGSWNRSRKSGYQVVAVFLDENGGATEEAFATGYEIDEKVSGRPVDVAVGPDGALYVSDDYTGSVHRIAYDGASGGVGVRQAPAAAAGEVRDPLAALSDGDRAAAVARGRALFDSNGCAACHLEGEQRKGETYKPLRDLAQKYSIDSLAAFLAAPQPPMPRYPFDDAARRDLAVWLLAESEPAAAPPAP